MSDQVVNQPLVVETSDTKPHLFFSVLTGGGQVWEHHAASREALRTACAREGIHLTISRNSGTGVDRARNIEIVKARMIKDPVPVTHFIFVDSDIVFDPQYVLDMLNSNFDIVGAAYPKKDINWEQVHAAALKGVKAEDLAKHSTSFVLNGFKGKGVSAHYGDGRISHFIEVQELGTGFLMFKMEVVEAYIKAYEKEIAYIADYEPRGEVHHMVFSCERDPECNLDKAKRALLKEALEPTWDNAAGDHMSIILDKAKEYREAAKNLKNNVGRYLTEDYSWCRRCEALGYKVMLYLNCNLGHLGSFMFTGQPQMGLEVKEVEDTNGAQEVQSNS